MLAEFSIFPFNAPKNGDAPKVSVTLETTGLENQPGPVGTKVEGGWEEVMATIRGCHQRVSTGHGRVVTIIVIDDDMIDGRKTTLPHRGVKHEACAPDR